MDKEIIKKIKEKITGNIAQYSDSYPKFSNPSYRPFRISENNFHHFAENDSGRKMAFVDGGNMEIVSSPNLSLSLIRVYYCVYRNNARIESRRQEFYAMAYADNMDDEISYKTEIFSNNAIVPDKNDLIFNSFDSTIKTGSQRAEISKIGEITRRFTELSVAAGIINGLGKNDLLILDGSLQSMFTNESKYLCNLYSKAGEKGVLIAALSKTSSLMTDRGNSFVAVLENFNKQGKWYYHPVAEVSSNDHKADIFFVKFHENSDYIFRFECCKEADFNPGEVFGLMANNCRDPVFLGYPYALIEADRLARIQENEKGFYVTALMAEFGNEWKKLKPYLNTKNAHSILDSIG